MQYLTRRSFLKKSALACGAAVAVARYRSGSPIARM
ncbi:MAG: twin-arginine translocation signal domain-containing protein [Thermoguttaceae bacterium]